MVRFGNCYARARWRLRLAEEVCLSRVSFTGSAREQNREFLRVRRCYTAEPDTTAASQDYRLSPSLLQKAQAMRTEYKALEDSLSESYDASKAKRQASMESLVTSLDEYEGGISALQELHAITEATDEDSLALKGDALVEIEEVTENLSGLKDKIKRLLIPPHPFADQACILELRPGVGGSEAKLFTMNLLDMYVNYCQAHRLKFKLLTPSQPNFARGEGLSEAMLLVDEAGAYDRLRFEGGVHRVQRVPETESKGRVHTSVAAVVVMPQPVGGSNEESNDAERSFAPGEVELSVMRSRGAGGQHVNTTESAVRLKHVPTGITVSMQDERSQHQNKAKAFMVLRARIAERQLIEMEQKRKQARESQVTSTDRADRSRTYNYPQNRITDHRCGFTLYDLSGCMQGTASFDLLLDKISEWSQAEEVKQLQDD
ncbi:uncharacterized protein V1518DRAFT_386133 [Limtongia smithiae]|uniref:uncharacterized protein n=1 Tax=Limtongia smithiae TaxID=1125753 RepID=UPI0034CF4A39